MVRNRQKCANIIKVCSLWVIIDCAKIDKIVSNIAVPEQAKVVCIWFMIGNMKPLDVSKLFAKARKNKKKLTNALYCTRLLIEVY